MKVVARIILMHGVIGRQGQDAIGVVTSPGGRQVLGRAILAIGLRMEIGGMHKLFVQARVVGMDVAEAMLGDGKKVMMLIILATTPHEGWVYVNAEIFVGPVGNKGPYI